MLIEMVQVVDREIINVRVDSMLPFLVIAKRRNGKKVVVSQSMTPVDLGVLKRRLGSESSIDFDYGVDLWQFTI